MKLRDKMKALTPGTKVYVKTGFMARNATPRVGQTGEVIKVLAFGKVLVKFDVADAKGSVVDEILPQYLEIVDAGRS